MRCSIHCPTPERSGAALLAIATGAAVLGVVLFVATHIWLLLGAAACEGLGVLGVAIGMRARAGRSITAVPEVARRLAASGVRGVRVLPGAARPQPALAPPSWRVTSVEVVRDAIPGR